MFSCWVSMAHFLLSVCFNVLALLYNVFPSSTFHPKKKIIDRFRSYFKVFKISQHKKNNGICVCNTQMDVYEYILHSNHDICVKNPWMMICTGLWAVLTALFDGNAQPRKLCLTPTIKMGDLEICLFHSLQPLMCYSWLLIFFFSCIQCLCFLNFMFLISFSLFSFNMLWIVFRLLWN